MAEYHRLKAHVFVCMNERPEGHPRSCCKAKDAEGVLKAFKEEVLKRGLNLEVRAQKAGCLDTCERGVSVVVYPEAVWYGEVKATDVAEIVESHLVKGEPVSRLRF